MSNHQHPTILNKTGILVSNLGTPEAPTTKAVRQYLAEFLWDKRIVELPRLLWWLILHGVILRTRPQKSAKLYQSIWTKDGSPLLTITRTQAELIAEQLTQDDANHQLNIQFAMRYGQPSIAQAMNAFKQAGIQRLFVLPLYPQYSATTTASTIDAVMQQLSHWRFQPSVRTLKHYADDPLYITAMVNSIKEYLDNNPKPDCLLFSFHGLPKAFFEKGDPYYCYCQKTARLIAEQLGLGNDDYKVTFQSRLGRMEWLQPYTDKSLQQFPSENIKRIAVVCPGFAADCLETLEEIAITNKNIFMQAGGEHYDYIPCLNTRPDHIHALCEIIKRECSGWL